MRMKTYFVNIILIIGFNIFIESQAQTCFPLLGCFYQSYPWVSPSRPFPRPESPEEINVTLYYYTRDQTQGEWFEIYPNITFNGTGFDPNRRTVTITHGFASSALQDWVIEMKDKYLENIDANIFLVNWAQGADGINYFQAAANTRVAGAVLGRFGRYLIEERGVTYDKFHLIGHSLGSHISSYAAEVMNNASTSDDKVERITGLDPAQPGFQSLSTAVRLSNEDAKFVDIIHSDAKPFIPFFGFGYLTQIGDVDFYLNRGYGQPSCVEFSPFRNVTSIYQLRNISVEVISKAISCSHGRSYEIFTSSIDISVPCNFTGHRLITRLPISSYSSCGRNGSNCINMGLDTPNQAPRGSFQVSTSGVKPYCCYNYSIIRGCSSSPNKTNPIIG